MTFTEAAVEVLRREGKPLHFKKIAEIAVRENLLDHVGKVPEETMADQLAAHCRQPRAERNVMPVALGTFALAEWGLEEDPAGLEGLVEAPVEEELYRGRERHPIPSRDLSRSAGRGEGGKGRRREEEERRGRRFPPPAEVAYEILAGAGRPLALAEIAAQGADRLLMPDAFVRDAGSLQAALQEDNRRRESAGRKALFQVDGDVVTLVAQPEPGERPAAQARGPSSATDARRSALAALRRRLRECDPPTVEHVVGKLLEKQGFRDLRVAKRGREHVTYTGKRRMGLVELRHAIRIARGGAEAGRREVADLRRDLAHYGAQIGVVVTAGDAAREARGEAAAAGQLPVLLVCGEAFAEALADAGVGCVPIVIPEIDEAFFATAAEAAEREEEARRTRREERDRRGPRREPRPSQERPAEAAASGAGDEAGAQPAASGEGGEPPPPVARTEDAAAAPGEPDEAEESDVEEEEGPEPDEKEISVSAETSTSEAGAAGDRRRRRRRRRRRGGRGRSREGASPGGEAQPGGSGAAAGGAADAAPPAPAGEPREPGPSGGREGGGAA